MCSIEGVVGSEGGIDVIPELAEVDEQNQKVDFRIYSSQRPKICVDFQEVQLFENKVIVVLSDGSEWNIIAKDVSKVFETISKSWLIGDDMRINFKKDCFILKNARDEMAFLAKLDEKCTNTANAFFIKDIDRSGYAMITTDDRLWVTGYVGACNTQHWQVGDRVIINKGFHGGTYDDYEVINAAHPNVAIWVTQVFETLKCPNVRPDSLMTP